MLTFIVEWVLRICTFGSEAYLCGPIVKEFDATEDGAG